MNRKSFFRGFGVGILFSAAVLGISFMIRTSDAYVKSRARELGMVYASQDSGKVLASADTTEKPDASAEPESSPNATGTAVPKGSEPPKTDNTTKKPTGTATPAAKSTPASQSTPAAQVSKKPSSTKNPIDMKKEKDRLEKDLRNEEKKLTINAGDWSSDVSRKLEKLGIVKSAADFDKYLEQNGYSAGISAGTYTVSKGDTYSQLAKKITGR